MIALRDIEVGAKLPPLELPPISRTTLALFAGASGDHNPIRGTAIVTAAPSLGNSACSLNAPTHCRTSALDEEFPINPMKSPREGYITESGGGECWRPGSAD